MSHLRYEFKWPMGHNEWFCQNHILKSRQLSLDSKCSFTLSFPLALKKGRFLFTFILGDHTQWCHKLCDKGSFLWACRGTMLDREIESRSFACKASRFNPWNISLNPQMNSTFYKDRIEPIHFFLYLIAKEGVTDWMFNPSKNSCVEFLTPNEIVVRGD